MVKFSKLDHSNLCLKSVEDFGKIAKYNDHFQQQDEVALLDLMLFNSFNDKKKGTPITKCQNTFAVGFCIYRPILLKLCMQVA